MSQPLLPLRPLEILHVEDNEGRPAFLLRDPLGYSDDEVVLSEAALFVASHMDGAHSLENVLENFEDRYRTPLEPGQVDALVEQLDAAFFLENPSFEEQKARIETRFLAAPSRSMAHAGAAYPESKEECLTTVTGFFEAARAWSQELPAPPGPLLGLVAPHIDLRVGGPCTALAYQALSLAETVETVVVLGTSHACPDPWMIVSEKQYETPFGPVETNLDLARELQAAAGTSPESELFHFKEHSVEFQAVFLGALQASGRKLSMVPVLCGSMRDAESENRGEQFWKALKTRITEQEGRTVVIAAADLAHVGPRFGDPELDEHHLKLLEQKDRATLEVAASGNAEAFFSDVTAHQDPRKICGLSPIYGLLKTLPSDSSGHLLRYEQATDETGTVSYASMGFWGTGG